MIVVALILWQVVSFCTGFMVFELARQFRFATPPILLGAFIGTASDIVGVILMLRGFGVPG